MGGHKYQMRYPTTEEIAESKKIGNDNDKATAWFYSFIKPVDEGAPSIEDTMKKANIKLVSKFNKMMFEEIKAED
jgi:hypothetical protein